MKNEKIECLARVVYTGSACARRMGIETPFVRLTLDDGREVVWHSANAAKAAAELVAGVEVAVVAFLRKNALFRVQLSKGCRVWGMGS